MNNFEKIKNMTLDEMAETLLTYTCKWCKWACSDDCEELEEIKQWLEQESEG